MYNTQKIRCFFQNRVGKSVPVIIRLTAFSAYLQTRRWYHCITTIRTLYWIRTI